MVGTKSWSDMRRPREIRANVWREMIDQRQKDAARRARRSVLLMAAGVVLIVAMLGLAATVDAPRAAANAVTAQRAQNKYLR